MSTCFCHKCPSCGLEIEVWEGGHPFILDDAGKRHFFYHPAERDVIGPVVACSKWAQGKTPEEIRAELPQHLGNLTDAICLECGAQSRVEGDPKLRKCRKCGNPCLHDKMDLGGQRCPKCKSGLFPREPVIAGIS